jgi:hypothetical protein
VAEHEVAVGRVERSFAERGEGFVDAFGERNLAPRVLRLWIVELSTHVGGDNADAS